MSELVIIETSAGPARLQRTGRRTLAIHVLPDGSLELTAPQDATAEAILAKVEKRSEAEDQFSRRMETWKPWCKKHHLPEPVLKIRRMPKRWGSAGLAGRLL